MENHRTTWKCNQKGANMEKNAETRISVDDLPRIEALREQGGHLSKSTLNPTDLESFLAHRWQLIKILWKK